MTSIFAEVTFRNEKFFTNKLVESLLKKINGKCNAIKKTMTRAETKPNT